MRVVEIQSRLVGEAAVVYPGPYLNQLRGEMIERRCLELLEQGVRRLVINFEQTEMINSIGISILMGVVEATASAGGKLVLSNLNPGNRELFEVLGLLAHVDIADTETAAVETGPLA